MIIHRIRKILRNYYDMVSKKNENNGYSISILYEYGNRFCYITHNQKTVFFLCRSDKIEFYEIDGNILTPAVKRKVLIDKSILNEEYDNSNSVELVLTFGRDISDESIKSYLECDDTIISELDRIILELDIE